MGLDIVFLVYDSLWLFILISIQHPYVYCLSASFAQQFLRYTMYNQVSNVSYFDTSSI